MATDVINGTGLKSTGRCKEEEAEWGREKIEIRKIIK
jgi:hypothetical protein